MPKTVDLILGSAMWGWTATPAQAFALLDAYYEAGHRRIDAATNYPINKKASDFRASERILQEWLTANGVHDLEVIMKVGSLNNLRTPDQNLQLSFLLLSLDDYAYKLGTNFHTLMVHWDNRNDRAAIEETFTAFAEAKKRGLHLGLSGIKYPEYYASINEAYSFDFQIEAKHNLLQSDLSRYSAFSDKPRLLTYGMNGGGIKLDQDYAAQNSLVVRGAETDHSALVKKLKTMIAGQRKGRAQVTQFFQIGMLNAYYHPQVAGMLVGPSSVDQLKSTLSWYAALQADDYSDIYEELNQA